MVTDFYDRVIDLITKRLSRLLLQTEQDYKKQDKEREAKLGDDAEIKTLVRQFETIYNALKAKGVMVELDFATKSFVPKLRPDNQLRTKAMLVAQEFQQDVLDEIKAEVLHQQAWFGGKIFKYSRAQLAETLKSRLKEKGL